MSRLRTWLCSSPGRCSLICLAAVGLGLTSASALAAGSDGTQDGTPGTPISAATGVYTAEQAAAGKAKYTGHCASCHRSDLTGDGDCVSSLVGPQFRDQWGNKTLDEYFTLLRTTMPMGSANSLPPEDYADIVAYLLSENGFRPGKTRLTPEPASLRGIKIVK